MRLDSDKRMVFGDLVDKAFWLMIAAFLGWIGLSVTQLNEKVAVIISRHDHHEQRIQDLEDWVYRRDHDRNSRSKVRR